VQEEGQGGKERLEASRQRLEGQIGEGSGGAGAGGSGEVKGKGKEKKEKEKKKGKGCVVMWAMEGLVVNGYMKLAWVLDLGYTFLLSIALAISWSFLWLFTRLLFLLKSRCRWKMQAHRIRSPRAESQNMSGDVKGKEGELM
jgi:hypothetical protein